MVAAGPAQLLRRCFSSRICNLYGLTKGQKALIDLVRAIRDLTGNLPQLFHCARNRNGEANGISPRQLDETAGKRLNSQKKRES
jgi:hypothetical protein